MPLIGHSPCLWASRTLLWRRPGVVFLRWRSETAHKRKPAHLKQLKAFNGDEKKILKDIPSINNPTNASHLQQRPSGVPKELRTRNIPEKFGVNAFSEKMRTHIIEKQLFPALMQREFSQLLSEEFPPWKQKSLWGIMTTAKFDKLAVAFSEELGKLDQFAEGDSTPALFTTCRGAYVETGIIGLRRSLKLAFSTFLLSTRISKRDLQRHVEASDMMHPSEWFPATRALQRKVILHIGPTNSGKTYNALNRLGEAKTGIYAGPLRLLAHEVYTRFNAKNVPCALVTGEERRLPPNFDESQEVAMRSCTVEMVPLSLKVDVAVIDEIQMMGNPHRGWAWTQAFLGLQANELHLCGEERTAPLIKDLCALMGDKLEVHRYKRLSPLKAMTTSLRGGLKSLRKGDCVIAFSRIGIHQMKRDIERTTGKLCAVVYGSLPPETRAQQAALFNNPDNDYDFLAASDAVGMGLNLSIKRIVFDSIYRFNGVERIMLEVPQLKQIAGRAGRYRTAAQAVEAEVSKIDVLDPGFRKPKPVSNVGLVTCLNKPDLSSITYALTNEPDPISQAYIIPSDMIVQNFASYFPPKTPFSYILTHLHEVAKLPPRFRMGSLRDHIQIADTIQDFNLTVPERLTLCSAPVPFRMAGVDTFLRSIAKCVAEQSGGALLDIPTLNLEILDQQEHLRDKAYLEKLEALHSMINLYLWVGYRFVGIFKSMPLAFHVKEIVEEKITRALASSEDHHSRKRARYLRTLEKLEKKEEGLAMKSVKHPILAERMMDLVSKDTFPANPMT